MKMRRSEIAGEQIHLIGVEFQKHLDSHGDKPIGESCPECKEFMKQTDDAYVNYCKTYRSEVDELREQRNSAA